jgi:hypothetical protein
MGDKGAFIASLLVCFLSRFRDLRGSDAVLGPWVCLAYIADFSRLGFSSLDKRCGRTLYTYVRRGEAMVPGLALRDQEDGQGPRITAWLLATCWSLDIFSSPEGGVLS